MSLMQLATKPKATSTPVKIDFKPTATPAAPEQKPSFTQTPAFDMGNVTLNDKLSGAKEAANIGKSLFSNIWGLIKGVATSPYTAAKTAWEIGQSIAGAQQEGVTAKDVLKEMLPSAGKELAPPAVKKGIEAGKEKGTGEGVYQGVKSLAEDPFQLLPYGLLLKGLTGKPKTAAEIKTPGAKPPIENPPVESPVIKSDNAIVGKILQGEISDVAKGARALQLVDTKNIKTYQEGSNVLKAKIENLAQKVDEKLETDNTPQPMAELTVKANVGGKIISTNYVDMALKGLKEMYEKTNDPANAERINQIIQKADNEGLTAKEVNYIAREFGSEFKNKAFSKSSGEALTSVNATGYENIRSGVKNTARQLMPDAGTKAIDAQIADLYNTKRLFDDMAGKVNSLEQRVQTRNLGQKIGRVLGIAFDIGTGGIAKGFFKKVLLESNVGLKSMNALDIQAKLSKNLRILDKLNSAKTDFEFVNFLTDYIKENKEAFLIEAGLGGIQSKTQ